MVFRYYTNVISQATKNFAKGTFLLGLFLIGFGFLVFVLRDIFAILAAGIFFFAGGGCIITALKMFLTNRKMKKFNCDDTDTYRKNVQIHTNQFDDF